MLYFYNSRQSYTVYFYNSRQSYTVYFYNSRQSYTVYFARLMFIFCQVDVYILPGWCLYFARLMFIFCRLMFIFCQVDVYILPREVAFIWARAWRLILLSSRKKVAEGRGDFFLEYSLKADPPILPKKGGRRPLRFFSGI